ncbi:hypothetical protein [Sphingomonas sp.]|jgi:hypothetical protein|nr:hypothetical protein [Sphingomonas sp.]HEX4693118.1 hypothetical protein [Sphingomonas sp.]
MNPAPAKKSVLTSILLGIVLAPLALVFVIVASLSGGPSEVFKALTGRK